MPPEPFCVGMHEGIFPSSKERESLIQGLGAVQSRVATFKGAVAVERREDHESLGADF
jgi:hypothetical protein